MIILNLTLLAAIAKVVTYMTLAMIAFITVLLANDLDTKSCWKKKLLLIVLILSGASNSLAIFYDLPHEVISISGKPMLICLAILVTMHNDKLHFDIRTFCTKLKCFFTKLHIKLITR